MHARALIVLIYVERRLLKIQFLSENIRGRGHTPDPLLIIPDLEFTNGVPHYSHNH